MKVTKHNNNEWRFTNMKLHFQKVKEGQIKITVCRKGCCDKDKINEYEM